MDRVAKLQFDDFSADKILREAQRIHEVRPKQRKQRALVLGWWGSTTRSLHRYDELHEKLGAELVTLVPCSTNAMFGQGEDGNRVLLKAAEAFQDIDSQNARVVVHVFSNGGLFIYLRLFEQHPEWRAHVMAVIFDSTPGNLNFMIGYRALMANTPKLRPVVYGAAFVSFWSFFKFLRARPRRGLRNFLLLFILYMIASVRSARREKAYHDKVITDPMCVPSLYVYSKADQLVDYRMVERVFRSRSQHKPVSKCFEASPHVAHCKAHPEEYTAMVQQLIEGASKT